MSVLIFKDVNDNYYGTFLRNERNCLVLLFLLSMSIVKFFLKSHVRFICSYPLNEWVTSVADRGVVLLQLKRDG